MESSENLPTTKVKWVWVSSKDPARVLECESMFKEDLSLEQFKNLEKYKFLTPSGGDMVRDAIQYCNFEIAEYLLDKGIELTKENIEQIFSSMDSFNHTQEQIIRFLVDKNIITTDYYIESRNQYLVEFALQYCKTFSESDLVEYISSINIRIRI